MSKRRLHHDATVAIAKACVDVIAPCIDPELHKQAWQ